MISMLRRFVNRLIAGGTRRLRPYEQECLAIWQNGLSADGKRILQSQLARFDLVQRLSKDKIVTLYSAEDPGFRNWPTDALFPMRDDEVCVARILFHPQTPERETELKADVVLHKGRLSSVEFSRPPAKSLRIDPAVARLEMFADPMKPYRGRRDPVSLRDLTGWVRDWAIQRKARNLRRPLSPSEREPQLACVDADLPPDYLDIVAQTEGMELPGAVIRGLSELRRIVLPEANYYILAEIEARGELGVPQAARQPRIAYIDGEDHEVRDVGPSLRAAMDRLLADGTCRT
jgi:hypothetical protein